MKLAVVALLLCSSWLWAGSGRESSDALIITNVSVVDTRYGTVVPNVAVVALNGKIAAVAHTAIIDPGPHVQVINAAGKYLIPGLWDMNAHLADRPERERKVLAALYLSHGITGVRDLDAQQEQTASVATPGPEIAVVGPTLHPELVPRETETIANRNHQVPNPSPPVSLHRHLELLVESGSTPMQAIQSETFDAALYMANLDQYGVIESGHVADMVLLDQNPVSDIRNVQSISGVVLRGAYFSRSDLDSMLETAEHDSAPK